MAKFVICWGEGHGLLYIVPIDWVVALSDGVGHVVILVDQVTVLIHVPDGQNYIEKGSRKSYPILEEKKRPTSEQVLNPKRHTSIWEGSSSQLD